MLAVAAETIANLVQEREAFLNDDASSMVPAPVLAVVHTVILVHFLYLEYTLYVFVISNYTLYV
jgi:hypothetical protein